MTHAQRVKALLISTVTSWIDHRSPSKSAALAFYSLFSMTPILILAIAVSGHFFGAEAAQGEVASKIQGLIGSSGAQAIQALLVSANNPATGRLASLIAGLILIFGATSVFTELKGSLDQIWGLDRPPGSVLRLLLKTRLLAIGLVLALSVLLLASLMVSAVLSVLMSYADSLLGISSRWLLPITSSISFAVITGLFAVLNKTLPDARLSWSDVWIGAICTAALFSLGNFMISLYVGSGGMASSFGAAGSLIAVLLWIYYSALTFFLGAEFTRHYALEFGSLSGASAAPDAGH
jgi:membrane protein